MSFGISGVRVLKPAFSGRIRGPGVQLLLVSRYVVHPEAPTGWQEVAVARIAITVHVGHWATALLDP